MSNYGYEVKIDVTVNGSGFDAPTEINIKDDGEIPSAVLMFPTGINYSNKLTKKDIVRIYVGLDDTPDTATFTGHMDSSLFKFSNKISLYGSLNRAQNDQTIVSDYDNLDGLEISNAIQKIFGDVSELSWMTGLFQTTSPISKVPTGFRFKNGISKYGMMKQLRDMAGNYALFQHGDYFHGRQIPDPDVASPSYSLSYGDGLLNFEPESSNKDTFNYSRVKGKNDIIGEYKNDHRVLVDGLREMGILVDNDITSVGECYDVARDNVLSSIFKKNPMVIDSHLLIDAVPNVDVVEITGAPYGLSDNYLIKNKTIVVGQDTFSVQCRVTTPMDVLGEMMSQLLSIDRNVAMT